MFPIIPHLYANNSQKPNNNSVIGPTVSSSSSDISVIADCELYPQLKSKSFLLKNEKKMQYTKEHLKVTVEKNILVPKNPKTQMCELIQAIKFADDCHSFNVQVILSPNEQISAEKCVKLEIVKPIKPGQELILWYSEEVLRLLSMAFLIPTNIQDQKKYVCHKCYTNFEYPNPLKLHLTLNCNNSFNQIWCCLKKKLKSSNFETNNSTSTASNVSMLPLNLTKNCSDTFKFELKPKLRRRSLDETSEQHPTHLIRPLSEPLTSEYQRNSAFQPYQAKASHNILYNNNIGLSQSLFHLPRFNNDIYRQTNALLGTSTNTISNNVELTYSHAAQMETLVSNLGKSKQGHLCIYCGKIYSRKYGLKIHIRTHTGFKPLKCKYCLRPFGDPSNLNKHVRLHAEGETPYKCEICGKILVRKRDLDRHLKSRHLIDMSPEKLASETQLLRVSDTSL